MIPPGPFLYVDPNTAAMVAGSLWGAIIIIAGVILAFFLTLFTSLKLFFAKLPQLLLRYSKKKSVKTISVIVVGLVFLVALGDAFTGSGSMESKTLLIGIDAMDPKIVEKLMAQGKLPNFERLQQMGHYSTLETTMPPESPVAWTAAATGTNPGKFGVYDFVGRDSQSYLPKLMLFEEEQGIAGTKYKSAIKIPPFWKLTSDEKIKTTNIRWPVTFPAEKIRGQMLSGLGTVDIKGFSNSYSFYSTEDIQKKKEDIGKIVTVQKIDNLIETKLYGPLKSDRKEVSKPMAIELKGDHVVINVDGTKYTVAKNNWSDWISVKFKVNSFTSVQGIFKTYVSSIEPEFNMYVTTIQIDPVNQVADITYPKSYGKELVEEMGYFYTLGLPEDTKALQEGKITKEVFLEQVNQIEEERTKMFWYEFERFDQGVLAFAFDSGDRLGHIFWVSSVFDSELKIHQVIEDYYTQKDAFLGELLDKIDEDTKLIIFSDHGFSSFERSVNINRWLVDNDYMTLTQEPKGDDSGGLFKYVDWEKTKAYSLGFVSMYINSEGREAEGMVSAQQKDALIAEISEKLAKLHDTKTDRNVITDIYKSSELYSGDYIDDAPDIIIGFNEGYRMSWQNAVGGLSPEILTDNDNAWKGDHLIDSKHVPGVLFTNFKITNNSPSLQDIAPTVMTSLGIEAPEYMDGRSLLQ